MFSRCATPPYGGKVLVVAVAAALAYATVASAAGPIVPWAGKDMKTAIRAVGYPKPHPKKLACKETGTAVGAQSFKCSALYRHHRRRVFYTQGQGEGGWICAGKTLASCKVLRHGFVTTSQIATLPSMGAAADLAARGYLQDRGMTYTPVHFCEQAGTGWACPFTVNGAQLTVTITFKHATGGFIVSGAS